MIHLKFGQNPTLKDVLLSTCRKMAVHQFPSDLPHQYQARRRLFGCLLVTPEGQPFQKISQQTYIRTVFHTMTVLDIVWPFDHEPCSRTFQHVAAHTSSTHFPVILFKVYDPMPIMLRGRKSNAVRISWAQP